MSSCECIRPEVPAWAVRQYDGLRYCDCALCKRVRGKVAVPACQCDVCQKVVRDDARLWKSATHANKCEACGKAWIAHSRANVCPECWDKDLCRVCWGRPGIVCATCAQHLATPYSEEP